MTAPIMLLKVGDLVVTINYIGVYVIQRLSEDGVTADIEPYSVAKREVIPESTRISVPVTILRPFVS
jgi:hypothetical protein